jgi:hypothetical protein
LLLPYKVDHGRNPIGPNHKRVLIIDELIVVGIKELVDLLGGVRGKGKRMEMVNDDIQGSRDPWECSDGERQSEREKKKKSWIEKHLRRALGFA